MTPTDAQIEAAAREIFDSAVGIKQWDNEFYSGERAGCFDAARRALTAAAEVGDKCANCGGDPNIRAWVSVDLHREVKSATIECCAQVADNAANLLNTEGHEYVWCVEEIEEIAAAIRALKDA